MRRRWLSSISLLRLIAGGFVLLDTQYVTEHLQTFGAAEVPQQRYRVDAGRSAGAGPQIFLRCRPIALYRVRKHSTGSSRS